jgi:hypothetical protein
MPLGFLLGHCITLSQSVQPPEALHNWLSYVDSQPM